MMVPITEYDVFFISYDEPNADENWADLLNKCPWAKRSHGVWGSDAAHKACAEMSETERFVSVDADNIVDPDFFNVKIDKKLAEDVNIISWSGKNDVNGLVYGNGGIKCWHVDFVLNMKTHELSKTDQAQVDFCWEKNWIQKNEIYSYVYNNTSPYQAYRAGFREGVKMSLDRGMKINSPKDFIKKMHPSNLKRLLIWCTIGEDVENGIWCIYGARLGCYMTNLTDWDYTFVRDFKYHTETWNNMIAPKFAGDDHMCSRTGYRWDEIILRDNIMSLGNILYDEMNLNVCNFGREQSKFFKEVYINPKRMSSEPRDD